MKMYLDIDGVLLTKKLGVPDGAPELIDLVTSHFDCYWLTTHCRHGTNKSLAYLAQFYDNEALKPLKTTTPCYWIDLKTEGIDFTEEFIWLEDTPFEAEKRVLEQHGVLTSLWTVDLSKTGALRVILADLKTLIER